MVISIGCLATLNLYIILSGGVFGHRPGFSFWGKGVKYD